MSMYTMLCDTSSQGEASSRATKFVIIAIVGFVIALIEHVVGYSTNYWVRKGFGTSMYHVEGLWKECFCSSSCRCYTRDSSGDTRFRVAGIFESLGLVGLVGVLVLVSLGLCVKKHRTVIKVATIVSAFLTSGFILAGVVGIAATAAPDAYLSLHFSFALCAKAAAVILLSAFLLIVDIRPRYRAPNYTEHTQGKKDLKTKHQARQDTSHRPTLAEYLRQRDAESESDSQLNREAEYLGHGKRRRQRLKQHDKADKYMFNEKDNIEDRQRYQNKEKRKDEATYQNEVFDDGDDHTEQYKNKAREDGQVENKFNEPIQYARMDKIANEYDIEEEYVDNYNGTDCSNTTDKEDVSVQKTDTLEDRECVQNYTSPKRKHEKRPYYQEQHSKPYFSNHYQNEENGQFEQRVESGTTNSNITIPQLKRSPNASENRREQNWASRYETDNRYGDYRYDPKPVQVLQNYRRHARVDYFSSQTSPKRNVLDSDNSMNSESYIAQSDRHFVLPPAYSESYDMEDGDRVRQERSNETTV